jgi:RHS repeat-associated protein
VTYDAAGNVTNDGSHAYTFDAENRIICVGVTSNGNCITSASTVYVYNAAGDRVRKTTGGVSVDYLYDLVGHIITEVSSSGAWNRGEVFSGGHHIATYSSGTTYFIHADWLDTERMRTNTSGVSVETCTNLPFGDGQSCTGTDVSPLHFTGKQRDAETNLDDFGARYFNSGMARWVTPDWSARPAGTPYVDIGLPQSLNLYAYVGNNPITHTDPDGHVCFGANCRGEAIQSIPSNTVGDLETGASPIFSEGLATETEIKALSSLQQQSPQQIRDTTVSDQRYSTKKGAAKAAEKSAINLTKEANKAGTTDWEFGGWVVKDSSGKYAYTNPLKGSKRGEADIDNMIVPKGFSKVAGYHTHPDAGPWGEGFSVGDVNWAVRNRMTLYVGMVYSGNVRVFVPGVTEWKGYNAVTGDLIGNINH